MIDDVEILTARGWTRLGRDPAPKVGESDTMRLRGLPTGPHLRIGPALVAVASDGTASFRPAADEKLAHRAGHVGVTIDEHRLGEIEIVPDKISEDAHRILRADLHRVWSDLVFRDGSPTAVTARPPTARQLWQRIERPVLQILRDPSRRTTVAIEPRRLDQLSHRREPSSAVLRAGHRHRAAPTRTLRWATATPENEMAAATLDLLRRHARCDPDAGDIVGTIDRIRRHHALPASPRRIRHVTWTMRHDPRYRRLLAVHRILVRPELEPTEGPGDLRLGVPGLPSLYEYWVFLQVLRAAEKLHGTPSGPGFEALATPVGRSRRRLEIAGGATVTFPGPVHVAFEPTINSAGTGWHGLEYVPHPDGDQHQQLIATPDVVVLDLSDGPDRPALTVIDAKYVGRLSVEIEAVRMHQKYARMRLRGIPAVRNVLVAHPHPGLAFQWAGYGHFPLVPTGEPCEVPLHHAVGVPAGVPARP